MFGSHRHTSQAQERDTLQRLHEQKHEYQRIGRCSGPDEALPSRVRTTPEQEREERQDLQRVEPDEVRDAQVAVLVLQPVPGRPGPPSTAPTVCAPATGMRCVAAASASCARVGLVMRPPTNAPTMVSVMPARSAHPIAVSARGCRQSATATATLDSQLDPNDWRVVSDAAIGLRYTPLTTRNHQRVGTRERVLNVARQHPDRLKVHLNALATRVLFDDANRAIGVEYQSGQRLYGAHPRPSATPGTLRQVFAAREVILAGGAFNTPQLLMLSGIGPRAALEQHGIAVRADLAGVGQTLQDRYEVAVVNTMTFPAWDALDGATFTSGDAQYREWAEKREGVYATNGALISVVARSGPNAPDSDLFLYALLSRFEGYSPDTRRCRRSIPTRSPG